MISSMGGKVALLTVLQFSVLALGTMIPDTSDHPKWARYVVRKSGFVGKKLDPQHPHCARVFISGKMVKIDKNSDEHAFGQNAVFYKHPSMKEWPADHGFYVTKLNIEKVQILDGFGATKNIKLEDYFNANKKSR